MLAATVDGLFEVSENGEVRSVLAGVEVRALAAEGDRWWVVADGRRILCGSPDSEWEEVVRLDDLWAHCLLPRPEGLLVGTSEAHILRVRDGGWERLEAFDRVEARHHWYTPWGDPADTRSLAGGPGRTVFANVHVGGVWRSPDAGEHWEQVVEVEADTHQVLADPASGLVAVAAAVGVGVSQDGGTTWRWSTEGLHAPYCRAVALVGDGLVVSASTGPRTTQSALYRSGLDDLVFQRCTEGLPPWFDENVDTFCAAARGDEVVAGVSHSLFRSTDAGGSWRLVTDALPRVRAVAL